MHLLLELTFEKVNKIGNSFLNISSENLIFELWKKYKGKIVVQQFHDVLRLPDPSNLDIIKSQIEEHTIHNLLTILNKLKNIFNNRSQLIANLNSLKSPGDIYAEWWKNKPIIFNYTRSEQSLPSEDDDLFLHYEIIRNVNIYIKHFIEIELPPLQKQAEDEIIWARTKLKQTLDILPHSAKSDNKAQAILNYCNSKSNPEWDTRL